MPKVIQHENLFGGTGTVHVVPLLQGPAPPFTAVLSCQLAAGGSVGAHRQEEYPEIIVGLAGQGRATVDGTEHRLHSGDVVHLPLGAVLSLQNLSETEPLGYLIVKATQTP